MSKKKDQENSNQLVPWETEAAQRAAIDAARAPAVSNRRIKMKNGALMLDDLSVPQLRCVILDYVYARTFWKEAYRAGFEQKPVCYAASAVEGDLRPIDVPEPQAAVCNTCPHDEWGSAPDGGKGKRCTNSIKLALLVIDSDESAGFEVLLDVPKGLLGSFSRFVDKTRLQWPRTPLCGGITLSIALSETSDYDELVFRSPERIANPKLIELVRTFGYGDGCETRRRLLRGYESAEAGAETPF